MCNRFGFIPTIIIKYMFFLQPVIYQLYRYFTTGFEVYIFCSPAPNPGASSLRRTLQQHNITPAITFSLLRQAIHYSFI
ncbi:MAG TPA: hypothetical protein PKM63_16960 [Panacibacter sp.]|nr:hypothetical protein [Panacibacter sp.]HNP45985.1 hypothetical protein [Panacibacter sp.]